MQLLSKWSAGPPSKSPGPPPQLDDQEGVVPAKSRPHFASDVDNADWLTPKEVVPHKSMPPLSPIPKPLEGLVRESQELNKGVSATVLREIPASGPPGKAALEFLQAQARRLFAKAILVDKGLVPIKVQGVHPSKASICVTFHINDDSSSSEDGVALVADQGGLPSVLLDDVEADIMSFEKRRALIPQIENRCLTH